MHRPRCNNHRLRILHAIHDFLPRHRAGSEVYAFELCRALSADHDVTVLCADFDPARSHGEVTWRAHGGLRVVEIVNNWRCETFEQTYRPPVIGEQIGHVLRAVQPDVVHVHNLLNLSFDLPSRARAMGLPVVATLHDYTLVCPSGGQRIHRAEAHVCRDIDPERCARCFRESPHYQQMSFAGLTRSLPAAGRIRDVAKAFAATFPALTRRLTRAALQVQPVPVTGDDIAARLAAARRVFDEVDLFVAPSPSIAGEFTRLGIEARRIRIADYGFPLVVRRPPAEPGPMRIGYAGTIVWHKGVHVLIEAVRMLPPGSFALTIFGDPDVFPDYTRTLKAAAAGLPVTFAGPFTHDGAADVYAQIDVLVVPSIWLENSPLVIHEAFMAGVPVIGARIGGIADLIEHGRSGLLYDADSPAALAAAIASLIDHPERRAALAGQAPAVKTIGEDAREWVGTYRDLIARRGAAASAS